MLRSSKAQGASEMLKILPASESSSSSSSQRALSSSSWNFVADLVASPS